MFKKSALALVVATAFALPAHADIKNVDVYGQVAISAWNGANWATEDGKGGWDKPVQIENESRVGVRGSKQFANGPKFIWQMEGGNVADDGSGSGFGARDTFGGFEWDGIGKVRVGRMLTPLYELVDWPYSSITAAQVFDWAGDVVGGGNYDRQSNMARFDSAAFNGFSFNVAAGRGNESDASSNFFGAGLHYAYQGLTLHAAYERGVDKKVEGGTHSASKTSGPNADGDLVYLPAGDTVVVGGKGTSDTDAYLVGFELALENGFGFYGAYKRLEASYNGLTYGSGTLDGMSQDSFSLGAIYNTGLWQFKLAYAENLKPEYETSAGNFKKDKFGDSIISAQAMYFIDDAAVVYLRPYQLQRRGQYVVQDGDKEFGVGTGIEYYF
ncbi:porin [Aeromonas sp. 164P]